MASDPPPSFGVGVLGREKIYCGGPGVSRQWDQIWK